MALTETELEQLTWNKQHTKTPPVEPFRVKVDGITYGMVVRDGGVMWGAKLNGGVNGAFAVELPSGFTSVGLDADGDITSSNANGAVFRLKGAPAEGETGDANIEIVLVNKPQNGRITATMYSRNLAFFRQPYLASGSSPFEGFEPGENPDDFDGPSTRAPEYCESYAVYHTGTKRKVMHITRARCWDGNGDEGLVPHPEFPDEMIPAVRLVIQNGQWGYQFDTTWLASATLPIRIDPTLGYTSIGGTQTSNTDRVLGVPMQEGGTGQTYTTMFVYQGSAGSTTTRMGGAVYTATSATSNAGTLITDTPTTTLVLNSWLQLTLNSSVTTSANEWIYVMFEGERTNPSNTRMSPVYDASTGGFMNADNGVDYCVDGWPDPWPSGNTPTTTSVRRYSLYLEGPDGGGGETPSIMYQGFAAQINC